MNIPLEQALAECVAVRSLPDKKLAFCVSRTAINGGYHITITEFSATLQALIDYEDTSKDGSLQLPPIVHANP